MRIVMILLAANLIFGAQAPAPAPTPADAAKRPATGTFEEARRHLVRGTAAIEMAKSDADLAPAAEEFQKATELSPEWAFAWYHLGNVQSRMGRLKEAMASYKRYLALAPDDKEAGRVGDELIKLEFRLEQASRIQSRAGLWLSSTGGAYLATAEGNRLVFKSDNHQMTSAELDANTFWTDTPKPPHREYQLELQGTKVTGTVSRAELRVGKCTVPAEVAEVTGTYQEAANQLRVNYLRSRFQAITNLNLFLDPVDCRGVNVLEKPMVEVIFYGPLPEGGIGVWLDTTYKPGALLLRTEWSGHMAITGLSNPAAREAGLQERDEILAIDGVKVSTLNPGDAEWRLYGAPGTQVTLTVLHKKAKEPVEIKVQRIKLKR